MSGGDIERRLAAILAADVAGYSRLIGMDEGTLSALRALRRELIDPAIAAHRGRIVTMTGDGMLVEFRSVLDALHVAAAVRGEMARRNDEAAAERRIEFRIGIHQGEDVAEDGDIFGDGSISQRDSKHRRVGRDMRPSAGSGGRRRAARSHFEDIQPQSGG